MFWAQKLSWTSVGHFSESALERKENSFMVPELGCRFEGYFLLQVIQPHLLLTHPLSSQTHYPHCPAASCLALSPPLTALRPCQMFCVCMVAFRNLYLRRFFFSFFPPSQHLLIQYNFRFLQKSHYSYKMPFADCVLITANLPSQA